MFERLLEEETVVTSDPGDLYLFFTDGITEAMNAHDDCFGEARLGRLLEEHADLPPRSCASGCCARSSRSSATRRSTTT